VLSFNGFIQAGFLAFDGFYLWVLRSFFGLVTIASLYAFIAFRKSLTHLEAYNVMGILSDGIGGIILIFLGSILYPLLGLTFYGQYEYIVFAFVCMTGLIHAFAYFYENHAEILTKITVLIRIFMSSVFFALYYNGTLEIVALGICLFDMAFATYYLLFLSQKKETLCQK
jgi:cytochrome c oxidase cbb3-type subunit I